MKKHSLRDGRTEKKCVSDSEGRARALRADQGLCVKLESNSEPERARVRKSGSESQWEPKRGVTESHRKTGRASKRARLKPEGTRVS